MSMYFDYHATTPCDPQVVEAMLPYFFDQFANPGSTTHAAGRSIDRVVAICRDIVASLINASSNQIIFTGSATESNNIAILGMAQRGMVPRVVIGSAVEHRSVLAPIRELAIPPVNPVLLPVDALGHVVLSDLERVLDELRPALVSVQTANGETGTIQHMEQIVNLCHSRGVLVHTDAVQAVGRIAVDVNAVPVDLLTFSAHKIYGPKGIAALYIRDPERVSLRPIMYGGGQEYGLRPGTLNVPGIVGFAEAARLTHDSYEEEFGRLTVIRDEFERYLLALEPAIRINGDRKARLPESSSVTLPVEAEAVMARLSGFALSNGAACSAGAIEPSSTLLAMGIPSADAYSTLRVSFGRNTTSEDARELALALAGVIGEVSVLMNQAVCS